MKCNQEEIKALENLLKNTEAVSVFIGGRVESSSAKKLLENAKRRGIENLVQEPDVCFVTLNDLNCEYALTLHT